MINLSKVQKLKLKDFPFCHNPSFLVEWSIVFPSLRVILNISKVQVPEFTIIVQLRLSINVNINRILFVFDISDNACLKLPLILRQSIYAFSLGMTAYLMIQSGKFSKNSYKRQKLCKLLEVCMQLILLLVLDLGWTYWNGLMCNLDFVYLLAYEILRGTLG